MDQKTAVPLSSIYRVFFEIGLFSFGGAVSGWIQREVVEVRKWMSYEDFLSGIALTQILPGANATNAAVYVGQRLRGIPGAATALTAMLTGPFCAVILAAATYQGLLGLPGFQEAMIGTAAAAVGMLLRTSVKSALLSARDAAAIFVMLTTFAAVGLFRLPLLPVIVVVAPASVGFTYWSIRRRA
jgi:chromate transporter